MKATMCGQYSGRTRWPPLSVGWKEHRSSCDVKSAARSKALTGSSRAQNNSVGSVAISGIFSGTESDGATSTSLLTRLQWAAANMTASPPPQLLPKRATEVAPACATAFITTSATPSGLMVPGLVDGFECRSGSTTWWPAAARALHVGSHSVMTSRFEDFPCRATIISPLLVGSPKN